MGNIHLVTGCAGAEHITSADQGAFNAALIGAGQFVFEKGNSLAVRVISNNQIRVLDGELMMQGRFVRLEPGTYVDLAIENGEQSKLRNDLIVARYTRNPATGVEDCNIVVIKGTPAASNPVDPEYTIGDILNGSASLNEMPLYRVPLNGLNVGDLVPLFGDPIVSLVRMAEEAVSEKVAEATEEIDEKIAVVDEKIEDFEGLQMDLLWENASPTSGFPAQSITVPNMTSYDLILMLHANDSCDEADGLFFDPNSGCATYHVENDGSKRRFRLSGNTVAVEVGYSGGGQTNVCCIPKKFIGIKGVSA